MAKFHEAVYADVQQRMILLAAETATLPIQMVIDAVQKVNEKCAEYVLDSPEKQVCKRTEHKRKFLFTVALTLKQAAETIRQAEKEFQQTVKDHPELAKIETPNLIVPEGAGKIWTPES